jgi:hypothetical protein
MFIGVHFSSFPNTSTIYDTVGEIINANPGYN